MCHIYWFEIYHNSTFVYSWERISRDLNLTDTMISEKYGHEMYSDVLEMLGSRLGLYSNLFSLIISRLPNARFRRMNKIYQTWKIATVFLLRLVGLNGRVHPPFCERLEIKWQNNIKFCKPAEKPFIFGLNSQLDPVGSSTICQSWQQVP